MERMVELLPSFVGEDTGLKQELWSRIGGLGDGDEEQTLALHLPLIPQKVSKLMERSNEPDEGVVQTSRLGQQ